MYDCLMDLWFIPRISVLIKAIVMPFIIKTHPKDAFKHWEDVDPAIKEVFLTKGIINLFPESV